MQVQTERPFAAVTMQTGSPRDGRFTPAPTANGWHRTRWSADCGRCVGPSCVRQAQRSQQALKSQHVDTLTEHDVHGDPLLLQAIELRLQLRPNHSHLFDQSGGPLVVAIALQLKQLA